MPYEEILEKIKKAKELAEKKKKAHLAGKPIPVSKFEPSSKQEVVWDSKPLNTHRDSSKTMAEA